MGDAFSYPYYTRIIGTNYNDEMAVTELQIVLVNASNGAVSISTTKVVYYGPVEIFRVKRRRGPRFRHPFLYLE